MTPIINTTMKPAQWALLVLLSVVWGGSFFFNAVAVAELPPLSVVFARVFVAALLLVVDRPWALPQPHLPTLLALLGLAAISTAFAYVLYFRILATAGATNLLLVTFLLPVSAILLGVMFLGEVFTLQHLAGMLLIGAGLVAIDGRLLRLGASKRQRESTIRR